jgi:cbb3-type cytochrome oxidase maturation protein
MEILYLLVPVSLVLVFAIGALFWWSLRGGQFDDLEGPGYRVLMDDEAASRESTRRNLVDESVDESAGESIAKKSTAEIFAHDEKG